MKSIKTIFTAIAFVAMIGGTSVFAQDSSSSAPENTSSAPATNEQPAGSQPSSTTSSSTTSTTSSVATEAPANNNTMWIAIGVGAAIVIAGGIGYSMSRNKTQVNNTTVRGGRNDINTPGTGI